VKKSSLKFSIFPFLICLSCYSYTAVNVPKGHKQEPASTNSSDRTDEIYSAEESRPVKKEKAFEKKYLAKIKSSSPVAVINNRAVSLLGSGRPAEAEVLLTEALSEEKNEAAVYNNLGVAMEMSGRRDMARKMYQKACSIDPDEYFIKNLDTLDRLEARPDRSGDK